MSPRSLSRFFKLICAAGLIACAGREEAPPVPASAALLPPRGDAPVPAAEFRRLAGLTPPVAAAPPTTRSPADDARGAPAPAEALSRQDPRAPHTLAAGPGPSVVPAGPLPAAELQRRKEEADRAGAAPSTPITGDASH